MHITGNWKVRCSMCFKICFTLFFYFMPFNFSQDSSFLSSFVPSRPCAHLWLNSEKGLDLTCLLCVCCGGGAAAGRLDSVSRHSRYHFSLLFFFCCPPSLHNGWTPPSVSIAHKWKWGPRAATTECGITFLKYFESNNSPPASEISRTRFLPVRFKWSLSYL